MIGMESEVKKAKYIYKNYDLILFVNTKKIYTKKYTIIIL